METLPMSLETLAGGPAALDEFRITSAREIASIMRRLQDGSVLLNFNAQGGLAIATMLWSVDTDAGMLSFNADADDARTRKLVEGDDAVVVGYLDSVKIQFDVHDLVLVRGPAGSVLRCPVPRTVYRFQRRNAYRVRPLIGTSPTARLTHPQDPEVVLTLRVLDVSIGGCALLLPSDAPPVTAGVRVDEVEIALDADTRLVVRLELLHASPLGGEGKGVRLGCRFVSPTPDIERTLQRFIDTTQKRRRMMAL